MEILEHGRTPETISSGEIAAGLDGAGWEPTSEDVREAIYDTIEYFNRGKLTEAELKWALSFLTSQMVEIELKEVISSFGRRLEEEPRFARRGFQSRLNRSLLRRLMPEENSSALPEEQSSTSRQDVPPVEYAGPTSPEDLERFPASMGRIVRHSVSYSGPLPNPLLEKLTPEHITSLIDTADRNRARALEDRKHSRKQSAIIMALVVIPIGLLLGYFAFLQQNSLVAEIIKLAAVGLGGFGGGYGFARWRGSQ